MMTVNRKVGKIPRSCFPSLELCERAAWWPYTHVYKRVYRQVFERKSPRSALHEHHTSRRETSNRAIQTLVTLMIPIAVAIPLSALWPVKSRHEVRITLTM